MKSIKDQIILVTGSTDGIGKQTALDLAGMGTAVIVHGRNEEKTNQAVSLIKERTNNEQIEAVTGDLSSLASIRKMADSIHQRFNRIDVLINNAGVFRNNREISMDGFELTFGVNHLSYFLLTNLLVDLIRESETARIVNVASMAHASQLDFDNLQGEKFYEGYDAYSRSKLCNILFTFKLARILAGTSVTANVLHPGVISTKLLHEGWGSGGGPVSLGSETSVYLATSPQVENVSGKFFSNSKIGRCAQTSYDIGIQEKLWELSEEMVGEKF